MTKKNKPLYATLRSDPRDSPQTLSRHSPKQRCTPKFFQGRGRYDLPAQESLDRLHVCVLLPSLKFFARPGMCKRIAVKVATNNISLSQFNIPGRYQYAYAVSVLSRGPGNRKTVGSRSGIFRELTPIYTTHLAPFRRLLEQPRFDRL